jgi:hypothetical protein
MDVEAIEEEGLKPPLLEFRIAVEKFGDDAFLDFKDFNSVSGLSLAFGSFLVSEIIGVKDTSDTSD